MTGTRPSISNIKKIPAYLYNKDKAPKTAEMSTSFPPFFAQNRVTLCYIVLFFKVKNAIIFLIINYYLIYFLRRKRKMKKLSFILALIIALSTMIGLFAAPVYAADVTPDYIVGGASATHATIAEALEAAGSNAKETILIRVDADVTESASKEVAKNVTIYSDNATKPVVTYEGATVWLKSTAGKLTLSGLDIRSATTQSFFTPGTGSTLRIENCSVTGSATASGNFGAIYYAAADCGALEIDNSTITHKNRAIFLTAAKSNNVYNISITNNSTISSAHRAIQSNNAGGKKDIINLFVSNSSIVTTADAQNAILINQYKTNLTMISSVVTAIGEDVIKFNKNDIAAIVNANIVGGSINHTKATSYTKSAIWLAVGNGIVNISGTTLSTGKNVCVKTATPDSNQIKDGSGNAYTSGSGIHFNLHNCTINSTNENIASLVDNAAIPSTLTEYTTNNTLVTTVGGQLLIGTTAESESTAIRFVYKLKASEAELADFSELGFHITTNSCGFSFNPRTTKTVYTSIKASGTVQEADPGYYFVLVEVTGISKADFDKMIYVRPFIKGTDGQTNYMGEVASTCVNALLAAN